MSSKHTQVKKDKKAYEDALTKSDNYRDGIETEVSDYQAIDAQHRRNKKAVEKEERRLREIEEEGNDFPPMEEVEQTFKNSQREMREIKSQISSEKASANTALERIDRALTEKNGAASQLERLRDDKNYDNVRRGDEVVLEVQVEAHRLQDHPRLAWEVVLQGW